MPATYSDRISGVETSVAVKAPVVAATTTLIELSGLQTVDGVVLAEGDRVLVKDQVTLSQNGIYNASYGTWTRALDFNGPRDFVVGTTVFVSGGSTHFSDRFYLAAPVASLDSSDVVFAPMPGFSSDVFKFDTIAEFQATNLTSYGDGVIAVITEDPHVPHVKITGAVTGTAGSVKDGWEPMVFANAADLLASLQGARYTGAIWEAGSHRYEEMASNPDGDFLTNAGGAILKVLVGDDGRYSSDAFDAINASDVSARMAQAFAVADGKPVVFEAGQYDMTIPDGYDVYLLAGDDWMAGNNTGPVDSGGADAPDARILQYSYDNTGVEAAGLPFDGPGTATGVSPGLAFAKRILEGIQPNDTFAMPANRGIILVPAARNHTNGFEDWEQGDTAYLEAVTGIDAALAYGSGTNRFMGGIFAGGFSDVGAGTTKSAAKASLTNFVTGLQTAYNTQARFVFARFVTEYAATGAIVDSALAEMFENPYVTLIEGLTGVQEAGHRTTAAGSRTLGQNFATAFQFSGPTESTSRFTTIAGDNNRAIVRDGATFNPSRPLGVTWEFENSNGPDAYGVRGYRELHERADFVSTRFTGGQWPGFILPITEYGFSAEFDLARASDGPTSWPESPTTTFQATAIGLPEGNSNVGANAALGIALGQQNLWGFIAVVSTGMDLIHPDGKPGFITCAEFDMTPAKGSGLTSGAGVLVNCFDDPVEFAALALAGDAGGSFEDGIFFGNVQRFGLYFGSTFEGTYGFYGNEATFTTAAIGLPDGATNGIRFTNGADIATISQDGSGKLFIKGDERTEFMSGDVEDVTVFAGVRESDSQEFYRVNVATGTVANAAAATVKMRANSSTGRSVNAGGTINASGADYAEYHVKRTGCGMIAAGDVCGIDANGELTDLYDMAVRFVVKSTNPNLVGNDAWADSLGERPELPVYVKPEWAMSFGERPMGNSRMTDGAQLKEDQAAYDAAREQWETDKADDREAFYQSAEYIAAYDARAAYDTAHEALRSGVDRISYCGQVPLNASGGTAGDYVIPMRETDGSIGVSFVADPTLAQYRDRIGRVQSVGSPTIIAVGVA